MVAKSLWEILVPSHSNEGIEYELHHHKEWDEKVRAISGGLTILRTTKGQWVNDEGHLFFDRMIPVRVYCAEPDIDRIIALTLEYYNQEAVLAYEVSSHVKLVYRNPKSEQE